jgi:hypothetical protein
MTVQMPIQMRSSKQADTARLLAIGLLLAVLLYRAGMFAAAGLDAIRYPWELDYGEGIVWQQMRWIFTSKAYGPIDGFPAIVFHYPPLYHAVTAISAKALGTDELATGRAISLLSTLAAAVACAILVGLLLEGRASRGDRRLCSSIAGLLVFTYVPVIFWATFMRVDMLALALGLFGLVCAFKSLHRPRLIYLAALLFVAAVYTRQTAIAAPVAAFGVLLLVRPRLASNGIAASLILGMAILLTLGWLTHGGFYRHIFLYNINRVEIDRLWRVVYVFEAQLIYVALAGFVLARRVADLRLRYRSKQGARAALAAAPVDIRVLIAAAYLLVSTLMLVLVAKSGSNVNYFLDWSFALGMFAAMAPSEAGKTADPTPELRTIMTTAAAIGLAVGALFAPLPRTDERSDSPHARDLARLARVIAAADKPVISDDMVVLIRGGQDVRWESAIFAELASTGRWDERPFVERIRNHEFAFFITLDDEGRSSFRQRYNPAVAQAIDTAYPSREEMAGLIIHRPPHP